MPTEVTTYEYRGDRVTITKMAQIMEWRAPTVRAWIAACGGDIEEVSKLNDETPRRRHKRIIHPNGKTYGELELELNLPRKRIEYLIRKLGFQAAMMHIKSLHISAPAVAEQPEAKHPKESAPVYKIHVCVCPKCRKAHKKKMWFTGTGTVRKYCSVCIGTASRTDNKLWESAYAG